MRVAASAFLVSPAIPAPPVRRRKGPIRFRLASGEAGRRRDRVPGKQGGEKKKGGAYVSDKSSQSEKAEGRQLLTEVATRERARDSRAEEGVGFWQP